jgi:hypothetical protein
LAADGQRGNRKVRQRGQYAWGWAVSQVEGGPEAGAAILRVRAASSRLGATFLRVLGGLPSG